MPMTARRLAGPAATLETYRDAVMDLLAIVEHEV